ncbi:MAG TPA: DNA polymerase III subunit delta [Gemmatimonadales bacterium]|jgi:DNA polymerase-3 subunit delta
MAATDLSGLRRSLAKAPPAGSYYIFGAEGIFKDEALALLLDRALDPATRDFNLDIHSAQQLDPGALAAACATLPMMAERRVVVVRDIEAWKKKSKAKLPAVEYLRRPMPETVLVLVQANDDDPDNDLASQCTAIECRAPVGDQLEAWLDARLAAQQVEIAAAAREHLLRATGGDLGMLTAEVEKLAALDVRGPVNTEMVAALVGVRFGETADDWRDAVLSDDTARALTTLPDLLEVSGNSGVRLVSLLGTSLLVLRWARVTAERRKIRDRALAEQVKSFCFANRPGVGSYGPFAQLAGAVVGRWPLARLRAATAATLQADVALKATRISDEAGVVTDLVLSLAASRIKRAATVATLLLLLVLGIRPASAQAALLPTSPRFREIVQLAQDGYGDSARAVIGRVLARTAKTDSNYPEALYTAGAVANTGDGMRSRFADIVVNYSSSAWADKALLRLAQLDYGNGDMTSVMNRVTRLFTDYPASPVIPNAALWGARAAFDRQKLQQGCDWLTRGIAAAGDDFEVRNQLQFAKQRCDIGGGVQLAPMNRDSLRAPPSFPDTSRRSASQSPPAAPPPAKGAEGIWRIQVTAVSDQAVVRRVVQKIEHAGFKAYTVRGPGKLTKVQAGPFATRAAAAAALSRVAAAAGGKPFITTAP